MAAQPDANLDIFSPEFDPREALLCAQLSVPYPAVQVLNNLAECRRLLPPDAPDALPAAVLRALHRAADAQPVRAQHEARAEAAPAGAPPGADAAPQAPRARAGREAPDRFSQGPLRLVQSLLGRRVCVVTRHRNCVRGRCTGTLIAADRHLNLLLLDAEDVYLPAHEAAARVRHAGELLDASAEIARAVLLPAASTAGARQPAPAPLPTLTRRHLGQVLLRGESVALVHAAP